MSDDNIQDQAGQNAAAEATKPPVDTSTEKAFPNTDDNRTVAAVDQEIKAANAAVAERHPALNLLDELDEKTNALGGYAVSQIKPVVDRIRELLV